ncbi:MAG TPA: transposase [Anaerolineales bacterium]|nr:transposase [Anaerolineales bacterium]
MKTFKYRLKPSKSQRTKLIQTLELCRWVYNETLATRKNTWEQEQKSLSLYDTNKLLTLWKQEHPELGDVFSQVLQNVQERVDLAFKAFLRRVKAGEKAGYPRFRSYGWYDSFTFKQFGFELLDKGLYLSKIGTMKIILHRPIEGRIKTLTIQRDAVGDWYACFACEVVPEPLPFKDLAIGIDLGLTYFAKFSYGDGIDNPRFFRRDEKELAKAQRKLSKVEKGTPERAKRRKAVQHIHQRIANRRRNFAHQESRKLVNSFGLLVFEDLRIKNMLQNHRLAKSISDAAWRQLIQYTTYKAENAGRVVVLVEPRNTSQICSCCGEMVEKSLDVRVHVCPFCGLIMDRDQNAAINILRLGLESLGIDPRSPPPLGVGSSHAENSP